MSIPIVPTKIIEVIPNQPISFEPDSTDPCIQTKVEKACAIFQPGDPVKFQFKQNPCEGDILCDHTELGPELNPDVNFILEGPEIISNGDFASATDWVETVPGFEISGGAAHTVPNATPITLEQTIASPEFFQWHKVYFQLSNSVFTGDQMNVFLYGSGFTFVTADGNYSEVVYPSNADSKLKFLVGGSPNSFPSDLDNVSLIRLIPDWVTNTIAWRPNEPGWIHTPGTGGVLTMNQNVLPSTLYYVIINVGGRTAGQISVSAGGGVAQTISSNGTFSFYLFSGGGSFLQITSDADFDGGVFSLSIRQAGSCFDIGEGWTVNPDGSFSHGANGLTNTLTYSGGAIVDLTRYQLKFGVAIFDGSLILNLFGTQYLFTETTTDFPEIIYGETNGDLTFLWTPDADFDGAVSFELIPLNNAFDVILYDLEDNAIMSLSEYVKFIGQTVNVIFDFADLEDEFSKPVPYGCYKICMQPPCEEPTQLIAFDFDKPTENDKVALTTTGSAVQIKFDIDKGEMVYFSPLAIVETEFATFTAAIVSGKNYRIKFRISSTKASATFQVTAGGEVETLTVAVVDEYLWEFTASTNTSTVQIAISKLQSLDTQIKVDYFIVEEMNMPEPLCSQCIQYAEAFDCTKVVEATCDNDAYGFVFGDFTLWQRLTVARFGPSYPIIQTIGTPTTGKRVRTHGEREKKWKALFDYMGEPALDALSTQLVCDKFTIDGDEFFFQDKAINPRENKEGESNVWQVQIELFKQAIITKNSQ